MSVLVNTRNEQEEKILLAFLDSMSFKYQNNISDNIEELAGEFLDRYNREIDIANEEIEGGNFAGQDEVEQLFEKRRRAL